MYKELSQLFDESIQLELNVSSLYKIFCEAFAEDSFFWREMALEEKDHANLLQNGKERFQPLGKFPTEMMSSSIQELESTNNKIKELIMKYEFTTPTREEAFNIALQLEQSAGELHYQKFMQRDSESELDKIFQRLNRDDKDHAVKLRMYMQAHDVNMQ